MNNKNKDDHECEHSHDHGHHHDHSHDISKVSGKRLFWVVVLNFAITIAQIIGGIISGSLALVSDALHNFSDAIAIVISYSAMKIGAKEATKNKTFGYKRAEILAALFNSAILIAISVYLFVEAYHKFVDPKEVDGVIVIIIATIGLVANAISVKLLEDKAESNMNVKSAYLHMLSDALVSLGVIVSGIGIYMLKIYWLDPAITVLVGLYILKETFIVFEKAISVLMQSVPENIDIDEIVNDITKIEKVRNVHHIHIWGMTESELFLEAHVDVEDMKVCETKGILMEIKKIAEEQNIGHVTIQFEVDTCEDKRVIQK